MKMYVSDFIDKFRTLAGDTSSSLSDTLLIETINLAFNALTSVPKLSKAFSKHYNVTLDSKNSYKWELDGDFRRLANIPMLNFYSIDKGGTPCPLNLCPLDVVSFYNKHGVIAAKKPGIPCEYTIEQEDDHTYLVIDRPSDVPLMVDYIAYGYPKPITGLTYKDPDTGETKQTEIELSSIIENLILNSMREAVYIEAEDLAFSGAVLDIMTNKYIPEALQALYARFGVMRPVILGEQ